MRVPAKFKEYIWLVETIAKARQITLPELNEKWITTEMSCGSKFARATFNRHRDAIAEIFGIYIECDRSRGYKYYIRNDYDLKEESVQNWMLTTLSVNNMLLDSVSVHDRILLDRIPGDAVFLKIVVEAMKLGNKLKICYRKYGQEITSERIVEPYCIKLYHQRWYLLAHQESNTVDASGAEGMRLFGFDRIDDVEMLDEKFKLDKNFRAVEYFDDSYGVVVDNRVAIQDVVIRAYGNEIFYLRDLPMHHTQKEIGKGEGYVDFLITLRPTLELIGQILSRGSRQKVLKPQWLVSEIKKIHQEAANLY